jgi:hypothetical protein
VIRLAGGLLSEQRAEWFVQRRYLSVESHAADPLHWVARGKLARITTSTGGPALNATWEANVNVDELPALHHVVRLDL